MGMSQQEQKQVLCQAGVNRGDSPSSCCFSQLRSISKSSFLLSDKQQSLELNSAQAACFSPSPVLVAFPVFPSCHPSSLAWAGWEMESRDVSIPQEPSNREH